MLSVHPTQRLLDSLTISSGNLQTDLIDTILSSKKLTAKVEDVQYQILKYENQLLGQIGKWMEGVCGGKGEQERGRQMVERRKKEIERKIVLIQLRTLLKSKSRKLKTSLDTTSKSLTHNELTQQSDRIFKLNSSIILISKDLGIEQQEEQLHNSYHTNNRSSYVIPNHYTMESIEKEQTVGNESVLSIQNVVRRHQFVLDSEIKRKVNSFEVLSVSVSESRSVERTPKQTQSKQKQQNSQISNKTPNPSSSGVKPKPNTKPTTDISRKPPTVPPSKSAKESARIQQIKDNLLKYKEDMEEQEEKEVPKAMPTATKGKGNMSGKERVVVFSKSWEKGVFDEAIKQTYEDVISKDMKR